MKTFLAPHIISYKAFSYRPEPTAEEFVEEIYSIQSDFQKNPIKCLKFKHDT